MSAGEIQNSDPPLIYNCLAAMVPCWWLCITLRLHPP